MEREKWCHPISYCNRFPKENYAEIEVFTYSNSKLQVTQVTGLKKSRRWDHFRQIFIQNYVLITDASQKNPVWVKESGHGITSVTDTMVWNKRRNEQTTHCAEMAKLGSALSWTKLEEELAKGGAHRHWHHLVKDQKWVQCAREITWH